MKLRGEEVLTYRGMLRYVGEGLGLPDLASKMITNLVSPTILCIRKKPEP